MSQMHNPPRWLESNELSPELARDLSAYASDGPDAARRARMLDNLEQQLGFAEVASAELPGMSVQPALRAATGAGASTVAGTLVKAKLVLGLLATAGAALGVWALWSSAQSTSAHPAGGVHTDASLASESFRAVLPEVTRGPSTHEVGPTRVGPVPFEVGSAARASADVGSHVAPTPVARRERKVRPTAQPLLQPTAPSPAEWSGDELEQGALGGPLSELTLLARARRSLLSSPERSLELAEQHAREFPAGTLCEEREVLAIESLLKLGRVDRAKERALAFERRFPSSAHRAHLARLIARPPR